MCEVRENYLSSLLFSYINANNPKIAAIFLPELLNRFFRIQMQSYDFTTRAVVPLSTSFVTCIFFCSRNQSLPFSISFPFWISQCLLHTLAAEAILSLDKPDEKRGELNLLTYIQSKDPLQLLSSNKTLQKVIALSAFILKSVIFSQVTKSTLFTKEFSFILLINSLLPSTSTFISKKGIIEHLKNFCTILTICYLSQIIIGNTVSSLLREMIAKVTLYCLYASLPIFLQKHLFLQKKEPRDIA